MKTYAELYSNIEKLEIKSFNDNIIGRVIWLFHI